MKTLKIENTTRLPREVYYQCIWTVKDLRRIETLAARLVDRSSFADDEIVLFMDETGGMQRIEVLEEAARKRECIHAALEVVPEEYREAIIENIVDLRLYDDNAHSNTYKKWKQRFIYELAGKLNLY
ncbi:MAG: hypothetical protein MJ127_03960 [Mogibacterium sp.]|nr:hypothetical protein [Mogibacterium sp.]